MSPILQIKGITKRYGGLTANNNISFDVNEGEILSVIGPNGAGKSTLFKLIASFVHANIGRGAVSRARRSATWRRTRWRAWAWCGPFRKPRSSSR